MGTYGKSRAVLGEFRRLVLDAARPLGDAAPYSRQSASDSFRNPCRPHAVSVDHSRATRGSRLPIARHVAWPTSCFKTRKMRRDSLLPARSFRFSVTTGISRSKPQRRLCDLLPKKTPRKRGRCLEPEALILLFPLSPESRYRAAGRTAGSPECPNRRGCRSAAAGTA